MERHINCFCFIDGDLFGKKKPRKTKKQPFNMDDLKVSLNDNMENEDGEDNGISQVADFDELDMDFSKQVKKKKKKTKAKGGLEELLEKDDMKDEADGMEAGT